MVLRRTSGVGLVLSEETKLQMKRLPARCLKTGKAHASTGASRQSTSVPIEQSQATRGDMWS